MARNEERKTQPSHIVYHVRDGRDKDERFWDRCGVAFQHRDKEGFNVELSMLPVDGRLTLRTPRERDDRDGEDQPRERTRGRER